RCDHECARGNLDGRAGRLSGCGWTVAQTAALRRGKVEDKLIHDSITRLVKEPQRTVERCAVPPGTARKHVGRCPRSRTDDEVGSRRGARLRIERGGISVAVT